MWPFSLFRPRTALRRVEHSGIGGVYGGGEVSRLWVGGLGGLLPGTDTNWAIEVKDPGANATVHACLRWIIENIAEAPLTVWRRTGRARDEQVDDDHPVLDLLAQPNDDYDGQALLQAVAVDYALSGSAYVLMDRDNLNRPRELWWKPHYCVHPVWPNDGSQFISGYVYRPGGRGEGIFYKKEDVIHFRWGLDRGTEGRFGVHRTFPIYREIAGLNEMSTYTAAIMKNLGIIPYFMSPKDQTAQVNEGVLIQLREWIRNMFTRDKRGQPGVASIPMDVHKVGATPEELALDKIYRQPILHICGAFGIHPAVLFQSTDPKGLDNGGQHEQARKQSYHDCLIPMGKTFGRVLTKKLLPAFDQSALRRSRTRIDFDYTQVEALAEDKDAKHTRTREDYKAGLLDRAEARTETGREARPEDEGVYFAGPEADEKAAELSEAGKDADHERAKELIPEPEPDEDEED